MNTSSEAENNRFTARSEPLGPKPVFIGHTRFSVHQHGSGNFVATRKGERGAGFDIEEYTEWLYSSKRMHPRVQIFTRYGVPQLALAARDYNVIHYVSYSPSLPKEYKNVLKTAAENNTFLRLNEVEGPIGPLPTASMIEDARASLSLLDNMTFGVYRLDDDDVLTADYFSRLAPYVRPEFSGFWVSLGSGVTALQSGEDLIYAREWYFPKIAIGLMHVMNSNSTRNGKPLGKVNHRFVDFDAPTILDSREPGWFHVRHPGQDTNLSNKVEAFFPKNFRKFSDREGVHSKHLFKLFPALASHVYSSPGDPTKTRSLVPLPLTYRDRTPRFQLNTSSPVAVRVITESKESFQDVKVHFTLHEEPGAEQGITRNFLKGQGAKFSAETRSYFVDFIKDKLSSEYIAVLETPEKVHLKEVWLASGESSIFQVTSMMVNQL